MTTNRDLPMPFLPVLLLAALLAACSPSTEKVAVMAFTGATVWDGTGAPARPGTTILENNGRIYALVPDGEIPDGVSVVATVDLSGRTVVPGLVNTHGHVSGLWAPERLTRPDTRVRADLELYAMYGITTVNSLGDDATVLAFRDTVRPLASQARILAAGPVITDFGADEARASAEARADAEVDWLKLRVDDNLGTTEKMPWDAVQAVMDVGAERGIPVATHVFYLADAKRVLEMGSSMIAHSVRDVPVDDDFIQELAASGACYVPTLTREVSTFVYAERPDFLDDPFFTEHANAQQVAGVTDPEFMARMAASPAAAGYRVALDQAMENLATLSQASAKVAMGTDTGPAGRFPGYFEHMELWLMVQAGLTPEEALLSATSTAADCLDMEGDVGTIQPGAFADFLVFTDNPLADIQATRSLEQVYVAGERVR